MKTIQMSLVALLSLALLAAVGCGGDPKTEIQKVVTQLSNIKEPPGIVPFSDSQKNEFKTVLQKSIDQMKAINVKSCPKDFQSVFDEYRSAYLALADGKLSNMGGPGADMNALNKLIETTFKLAEVAGKYGVEAQYPAPMQGYSQ